MNQGFFKHISETKSEYLKSNLEINIYLKSLIYLGLKNVESVSFKN